MPRKSSLLEPEQNAEKIAILTTFIQSNPDARELKRALAVKLVLAGERYSKITQILGMHKSCITTWKQSFEAQGLGGIKLGYQGSKSYLAQEQREEVVTWLRTKDYWSLDELVTYLDEHYGVVYQSKQSYYTLLSEANISWKKSQKVNPSTQPELVKKNEKKSWSSWLRIKRKLRSGN